MSGFFRHISGPFYENIEVITDENIDYLSKIGIYYVGGFDLDISDAEEPYWPKLYVKFR